MVFAAKSDCWAGRRLRGALCAQNCPELLRLRKRGTVWRRGSLDASGLRILDATGLKGHLPLVD